MFKKEQKEKFSFRKYKDGRTDSKLIGATILAVGIGLSIGTNVVQADVVSKDNNAPTLVSDTTKVSSDSSATFRDDETPSNVVKVDAILDKDVSEPTKSNNTIGEADGSDVLSFKSEATVNYKLESDNSLLKSEKVQAGAGTVTTPYDKKGISYDTDGKKYRESIVDKSGISLSESTGKSNQIEANGKVYEYVRSEVMGADNFSYEKTRFNNIDANVTPEGLQNKDGEVNYSKLTGKVYLVEETADGQFGKYVVANNVSNHDDAVAAWKNGLSNAKDFVKENVTLEKGDSILVVDKDTYAVGSNAKKHVKKTEIHRTISEPMAPAGGYTTVKGEDLLADGNPTSFTIEKISAPTKIKNSSGDYELGTEDDTEKVVETGSLLKYNTSSKIENKFVPIRDSYRDFAKEPFEVHPFEVESHLAPEKATLSDHLKDINSVYLAIANLFERSSYGDREYRMKLSEQAGKVNAYLEETANFVKDNGIEFGLVNKELVFYHQDQNKLNELKDKIEATKNVLNGLSSKLKGGISDKTLSGNANVNYEGELTYNSANPKLLTGEVTVSYLETFGGGSGDEEISETVVYDNDVKVEKYWTEGKVAISKDQKSIVISNSSERETNQAEKFENSSTITYTPKDVLSVVRAYKVVGEDTATVNHYYKEQAVKESNSEIKGTVLIKHVDQNGNVISEDLIVAKDVTVANVRKVTKGDKEEVTYKPTKATYLAAPQKELVVDGVSFKLKGIVKASEKWNNTTKESGLVKEGVTTLVYEYKLNAEALVNEQPEYKGGATPLDPPTVEIPEFEGGVVPLDPPVVEIPEFEGRVVPLDPPVVENPKFEGGVVPLDPPMVDVPAIEIPKEDNKVIPGTPEKPQDSQKEQKVEKKFVEKSTKELPNTGTASNATLTLAGVTFAMFGVAMVAKKKD